MKPAGHGGKGTGKPNHFVALSHLPPRAHCLPDKPPPHQDALDPVAACLAYVCSLCYLIFFILYLFFSSTKFDQIPFVMLGKCTCQEPWGGHSDLKRRRDAKDFFGFKIHDTGIFKVRKFY